MTDAPPVDDPSTLSIREAYEFFLDAHELDYTAETLRDYETRLRQFVQWVENEQGIEEIGDLTGWHLEQFKMYRQGQGLAPTTVKGQMVACKRFLDWAAGIGAVDEMLPHKVNIPKLERQQETDETKLDADDAEALIGYFRSSRTEYASKLHTTLELLWFTGARLGGIRGLDLEDYDSKDQSLQFVHRLPETPLKKKQYGERVVGLRPAVCEVLDAWITGPRYDKRDVKGRRPLLCGRQGRPAPATIQSWSYLATQPCLHSPCPHGKERKTCEWVERNGASKCPSSRSPHQVRTGSITWQLNCGLTFEEVGERVNSDPDTLRRYYDKATEDEKLEERRRDAIKKLGFSTTNDAQ